MRLACSGFLRDCLITIKFQFHSLLTFFSAKTTAFTTAQGRSRADLLLTAGRAARHTPRRSTVGTQGRGSGERAVASAGLNVCFSVAFPSGMSFSPTVEITQVVPTASGFNGLISGAEGHLAFPWKGGELLGSYLTLGGQLDK